nr:hypothetical protein [Tanacetum cinerariifolium]
RLRRSWSLRVRSFSFGYYPENSLFEERNHHVIHKIVDVLDSIRLRDVNMLKEASEKHFIRGCHNVTLGHTFHSFDNAVVKIDRFSNSVTIEHVAETSIKFEEDHLEGIKGSGKMSGSKNTSKLLESKRNFNILNDKSNREGSIQVLNEADTFVELKNKHRANLFVDIE